MLVVIITAILSAACCRPTCAKETQTTSALLFASLRRGLSGGQLEYSRVAHVKQSDSFQFVVLRFGFLQDGNVGVAVCGLRGQELTETGPAQDFDNAGRHVDEL